MNVGTPRQPSGSLASAVPTFWQVKQLLSELQSASAKVAVPSIIPQLRSVIILFLFYFILFIL
jgi:hypothetical protein